MNILDSDALAERYRAKSLRLETRELLMARLAGSEQETDLTVPPNCEGYGRTRHFKQHASAPWVQNPLPIEPARRALSLPPTGVLRAQAFQNAACNWRCWYCYVPFSLLAADETRGRWWSPEALISMYASLPDRPPMIDLTGGQPDLVPEWVPWTMDALQNSGLADSVYLWSDDNLSNDYFWRYLSETQIEQVATWPKYGKVGCFKGFDDASFTFNTSAAGDLFARQFTIFERFVSLGIDLYAYVTLTTPTIDKLSDAIARFVDRLQAIDPNLPLRTVPLEVQMFTPVRSRIDKGTMVALDNQRRALDAFQNELEARFPRNMRELNITELELRGGRSWR